MVIHTYIYIYLGSNAENSAFILPKKNPNMTDSNYFLNEIKFTFKIICIFNYGSIYLCPSVGAPSICTIDVDLAEPIQLVARQVYVPRELGSVWVCESANTSPAFISESPLNHRRPGVGTPTTLHSKETVPCAVSTARKGSTNSGSLYALGTVINISTLLQKLSSSYRLY